MRVPIPDAIPDELAARLDQAGVLAHATGLAARRRAAALATQIHAATRTAPTDVQAQVDAELADIRQALDEGRQAFRRQQLDRGGQALGTLVFAALSVLLLDVFWTRDLIFPDIPVVTSHAGAPERTAFFVTSVTPGTTGPEAGTDAGSDPGRADDDADLADTTPSPDDTDDGDLLGQDKSVADATDVPPPATAPPDPGADDDHAPPPGSAPDLPVAVAAPDPRPRPGTSVMRRMVSDLVPETEPLSTPTDTAVADAAGEVERDAAPVVDAPQGGGAVPGARPIGVRAALRRAGRPDLQVGVGPQVLALRKDAPIDFMAVGPAAVPPEQRARVFGLQVSRTEVTQKQWATVRHMDLSSISGQWDNPAEAMSFCDALRFANALSTREGLEPAYTLDKECEYGGTVRWDTQASGFRLLTEAEWLAMAATMPGTDPGTWDPDTERVNNRGMYKVDVGVDSEPLKVTGLADNAREWVWGVDRRPVGEADRDGGRFQVHSGAWPRSVVRGCNAVDPRDDPDQAHKRDAIEHAVDLSCRMDPPPAAVPLGVGLRLAQGRPGHS